MPSTPVPPPSSDDSARSHPSPLVGASQLAERLSGEQPPVLLDVRWSLAGPDRGGYLAGHLPGAVFVDLDVELAGPPGGADGQGRHPLPDPETLQRLLRRAGVDPGTAVVVYGERDTSIAARAWWLLRWAGLPDVAVLDGGLAAWIRAGLPVETGEPRPAGRQGTVTVSPGSMPIVDADQAAAFGSGADSALLDARAPERYRGETEPMDPVAGHIPGAANVPLTAVHGPDGLMLPAEELAAVLDAAGAVTEAPAAASCGSGVTACSLILAGEVAGRHFALYPGSYSGWCALGRPVETG